MKEMSGDKMQNLPESAFASIDEAMLDEMLASKAQESVKAIVRKLPEETVSLQWRSALNEKLLGLAPAKKKLSLLAFSLRTLAGVAVGCAICFGLFAGHRPKPAVQNAQVDAGALASALISEHRQTVVSSEIGGLGVTDADSDHTIDSMSDSDPDSL